MNTKKKKIVISKKKNTMRYLGNKTNLLPFIYNIINKYIKKNNLNSTFIDAFGGTGSVTQHFNNKGFNVISNDINDYAYKLCYSRNNISSNDLKFDKLKLNINQILEKLNNSRKKGFVYNNYSPNVHYVRCYTFRFDDFSSKIYNRPRSKSFLFA